MGTSKTKTNIDERDTPRRNGDKPRHSLAELLAQYDPGKHRHDEIDFGPDVGRERAD